MQKLNRLNAFLDRYLPWFVLLAAACGILFPEFFTPLKRVTLWVLAFLTFASSLGGGLDDMKRVFLHPLPVLTVLLMLHIGMPLLAMGLGKLLLPNNPLFALGLVLSVSLPTAAASPMWAGVCRGNTSLCVSVLLVDTLMAPFVLPLVTQFLVGTVVEFDAVGLMMDLVLSVAIPALLAMGLHQYTHGKIVQTLSPKLAPFNKLSLLLIVTANSIGSAPFFRTLNSTLLLMVLLSMLLCLTGFGIGYLSGMVLKQGRSSSSAMCLNNGIRNNGVGAVFASLGLSSETLFPIAFLPVFSQLVASLAAKVLLRLNTAQTDAAPETQGDTQ